MTKLRIFLILILTTSNFAKAANEYAEYIDYKSTPDWVEKIEVSEANSQDAAENSVSYYLVDNQMNLQGNKHEDFLRIVQKINSAQGLTQASELYFNFIPDYQRLNIHTIHIIRNGEVIDQTSIELSTMKQEQGLNNKLLTGQVTALAILQDIQVGDIIDYSFSISGQNPVFENKKFALFGASWAVKVDRANIMVKVDKARPLQHKVTGSEVQVTSEITHDAIIYRWSDTNITAEANEQNYPLWYQLFDSVEFSEFKSWSEVADWAVGLYDLDLSLNDELRSLNKGWKQAAKNNKEYVKQVISFVQNDIRYFGIELAENSHKPRPPNQVFERRYGDCKDKALMISSLLKEYDIPSWSALVSSYTSKGVAERLPSPGVFDHVINKIIVDGTTFWVDGTNHSQFGELEDFSNNRFGRALLVSPETNSLEDMSADPSTFSINRLSESFVATDYNEPVSLDFEITATGEEAQYWRITLAQEGPTVVKNNILDYYKRQFSTSNWNSELEVNDDLEKNVLRFQGTIVIPDYWDLSKEQLIVPLYGENLSSYLSLPDQINRVTPLANYKDIEVVHDINVVLPELIDWELEEKDVSLINEDIHYQRQINTTSTSISISHKYSPVSDFIPVNRVVPYVDKVKQARDLLYFSVVIANPKSDKSEMRNKLRSLLNL